MNLEAALKVMREWTEIMKLTGPDGLDTVLTWRGFLETLEQ